MQFFEKYHEDSRVAINRVRFTSLHVGSAMANQTYAAAAAASSYFVAGELSARKKLHRSMKMTTTMMRWPCAWI